MAPGDMPEQRAQRRGHGRRFERLRPYVRRGIEACDQADAGGFHITLAAGHLAGKAQPRLRAQSQLTLKELSRVPAGVAMQAAEPGEFGVLEAWHGAELARLRAVVQLVLAAHH